MYYSVWVVQVAFGGVSASLLAAGAFHLVQRCFAEFSSMAFVWAPAFVKESTTCSLQFIANVNTKNDDIFLQHTTRCSGALRLRTRMLVLGRGGGYAD
jgi:hypothetical protein